MESWSRSANLRNAVYMAAMIGARVDAKLYSIEKVKGHR